MRLSFVRVDNWIDAIHLMEIRNQCREGMTHHREAITIEEQDRFFHEKLRTDEYEAYLLLADRKPVGFGMLRPDDERKDRLWMTIGLATKYRGRNLSYVLTNLITAMGHRDGKEVWLDVRADAFVRRVYDRCRYMFVAESDGLWIMCHPHIKSGDVLPTPMFKAVYR